MKNTKKILAGLIVSGLGMGIVGCSSGSSSSSAALNVSGVLSLGNSSQSIQKVQALALSEDDVSAQTVDLSQYKVSCVTTTSPVQTATASVGADGTFSVGIAGATGQPLSCFLVDSSGKKAADFLISNSAKKDLNGKSETTSTAAFKKDADLGTISFDPNSGEVTVPSTNISSVVAPVTVSASQVFDPTGAWTIGSVDFTMPSGAKSPCAAGVQNCNGPQSGQSIYLKLWKGTDTSDSSSVYGLQVWQGQGSFTTCGSKIGLTSAIKTTLGVDFSANGSADSPFSFATSVANFSDQVAGGAPGTVTLTDGWKMNTATLQYDLIPNCGPHDVTIAGTTYSNAWVCGPDNSSNYQAQLGGGCKDTSGNPVDVNNWSGITCQAATTDANGIKSMSCSGTASVNGSNTSVTCTNKWAVTNSSYVVQPSASFNWTALNGSKIAAGTLCSAIANGASSEALKIAQLQCYSNYYYNSGMEKASACLPKVDMDWSSTSSANFAIVDQIRPQGLIFFEKFVPFTDGQGGSMMTRQEHYDGVKVGDSWVNCHVIEVGGLNIKKVSDTKLMATYQSSTITTSILKPACLAKFAGARETFMFYLNK